MVTEQEIEAIGKTLVDPKQPLQARFRALFTLRGLGGPDAISWISRGFEDSSALLKHELAYCLGQMRDARAIPVLADVLQDTSQEPMVRHEAGEALGAIGNPEVLGLLKQYSTDPVVEVAETCQLAVGRLEWLQQHPGEATCAGPYLSVDPAPPAAEQDVGRLREALLDEARPLFERYRAMFALRNVGGKEAALALAEASERRLKPWLVGLAAVVGFLFIVFILMLANRVWCAKGRAEDEEATFRMEHIMNENSQPSKADKKQKKKVDRKGGQSNEALELEEKESSDEERGKKTAL